MDSIQPQYSSHEADNESSSSISNRPLICPMNDDRRISHIFSAIDDQQMLSTKSLQNNHLNRINFYRFKRILVIFTLSQSLLIGIIQNLMTIDRYMYGQWTFIFYSIGYMSNSLINIFYLQNFLKKFGLKHSVLIAIFAIIIFIAIHLIENMILFEIFALIIPIFIAIVYNVQLEMIEILNGTNNMSLIAGQNRCYKNQQLFQQLLFECPSYLFGHLFYLFMFTAFESQSFNLNHLNGTASDLNNDQTSIWEPKKRSICLNLYSKEYCDKSFYYLFINFNEIRSIGNQNGTKFATNFRNSLITAMILVSVLVFLTVFWQSKRINQFQMNRNNSNDAMKNEIKINQNRQIRLLLPLAFYLGFNFGFFLADYNKIYISCTLGLKAIGSIMVTCGAVHLLTILLINELFVHHIQRPLIVLAGAICQLSVLAILYLWHPNNDIPIYYVIIIIYSLSNAIMETILFTNVLQTFTIDEWKYAFLTLNSMKNLGLAIIFAMNELICLYIKLIIMFIVSIIAITCIYLCELRLKKFQKIFGHYPSSIQL